MPKFITHCAGHYREVEAVDAERAAQTAAIMHYPGDGKTMRVLVWAIEKPTAWFATPTNVMNMGVANLKPGEE